MQDTEPELSLKHYFVPLTTTKVLHFLIIIGVVLYAVGLFNTFVADDPPEITENIAIHSLANLPQFFTGGLFYMGEGQKLGGFFYRPLVTTYFSLLYILFGPTPFAFHVFQLVLFITNDCLVFLLFNQFFRKPVAFVLALVFLIHPINSEAAYYISASQEVLFLFFGMLSLLLIMKNQSHKALFVVSVCLFCSLLSKETGILFFFVSLVSVFLYHRKKLILLLGYEVTFLSIYLLLRISAIGFAGNATKNAPIQALDLLHRMINIPAMFLFYLTTFLFPRELAAVYDWVYRKVDVQHFFLPLIIDLSFLVLLGLLAGIIKKKTYKQFILYVFFLLWFLLGMLMHMQLLPLDQTVTDQWFYFPMIGLLGMLGVFLETYRINVKNIWLMTFIVLIVVLLSLRTFIRGFDWKDDFTLASHDLRVSKEAYPLEHQLSRIYFDQGNYREAKLHAERSIQLFPSVFNYTDLGNDDFYLGNYTQAKNDYLQALQYGDNYTTYENLAALYINHDNPTEGVRFIKNAVLKKYPYDAQLWLYLAVLEYNHSSKETAKTDIQRASQYNLGIPQIPQVYEAIMNNKPVVYRVGK